MYEPETEIADEDVSVAAGAVGVPDTAIGTHADGHEYVLVSVNAVTDGVEQTKYGTPADTPDTPDGDVKKTIDCPTARLWGDAATRVFEAIRAPVARTTGVVPGVRVTDEGVPDTADALHADGHVYVLVYVNVVDKGTVQTQYVVAAETPVKPDTDENRKACPRAIPCAPDVVITFAATDDRVTDAGPEGVNAVGVPDTAAAVHADESEYVDAVNVKVLNEGVEHTQRGVPAVNPVSPDVAEKTNACPTVKLWGPAVVSVFDAAAIGASDAGGMPRAIETDEGVPEIIAFVQPLDHEKDAANVNVRLDGIVHTQYVTPVAGAPAPASPPTPRKRSAWPTTRPWGADAVRKNGADAGTGVAEMAIAGRPAAVYCAVVTPETKAVCPTVSPCAVLVVKVTADADEDNVVEFVVKIKLPVAVAAPRFAAVLTVNVVDDRTAYTAQGAL